ncbi:uncharacterized protein LOC132304974 [Cornus florida]|uniref:uncharacterized protein LOC132304974 n=1 Tax=Cornus florida TaxID=4283 RepID=UPI0028A201E8|nr:uncharacterized protein LOC132304974 [Cornus florida]
MNAEDTMTVRKGKEGDDKKADKKRPALTTKDEKETKYKKPMANQNERMSRYKSVERYAWPPKLKSDLTRRPRDKYCRLYKDHGHATEDCFDLKDQIESLIRKGHIRKFTVGNDKTDTNPPRAGRDNRPPDQQPMGEIRLIAGECARDEDIKDVQQPHDNPFVVTMMIANYSIRRILVDNRSSADIIFLDVFDKIKIGKEKLRPTRSPLVGFLVDNVYPLGAVILPVTIGTSPKQVTVMVDFLVVDCPSAYNIILGRTTLNSMRAITSTYHLLMRFPIEHSVGELRGDHTTARECYVTSLKEKKQQKALIVEEIEEKERDRAKLIKDLVEICLNDNDVTKKVSIGSLLPSDLTNVLV